MNKTGLILLGIVLMASSINFAAATIHHDKDFGAEGEEHDGPLSKLLAARVSGVRTFISGVREAKEAKREAIGDIHDQMHNKTMV